MELRFSAIGGTVGHPTQESFKREDAKKPLDPHVQEATDYTFRAKGRRVGHPSRELYIKALRKKQKRCQKP